MDDASGFKVDGRRYDRTRLLSEAAGAVDALAGHLGAGGGAVETEAGRITRALAADEARLPAYPDVHRITDEDFLAAGKPAPVALAKLAEQFDFYWVRFAVGLRPQLHWGFNMLELRVEFGAELPAHQRPKCWRILPDKRFQELMKANMHLEVRLDENLEFQASSKPMPAAPAGAATLGAAAGAGGKLGAGAGAVFGSFEYSVKKARIDHSAPGLEWVFWRLDGAEFFQDDTPELILVLQVPKGLKACRAQAQLQASRYFAFGAAPWQAAIGQIPALLRRFFDEGMPLTDARDWDLAPSLG